MKRYKIISKKRFYLFITSILTLITIIFMFFTSHINVHSGILTEEYHELLIVEGDTLWDIALKYKPNRYDVRDMVCKIQYLNDINTPHITPGEIIKVPIIK
ncbi:LysM peptidoglycan-binding domain-containing protein [Wansuia hejianensis]|uniref:LysM peptidoglycan-binding domain-containing protein n=1 Tax=Wansuia hejianensis TaxID=2763667 RepID=A0A926INB8_9FIRM|nr:LysM peptidoglycan-binding domain-containing protein [Wansuia hejianensis]MBC8590533.1 LysM peptidoglycan-binding domain-containing protein [Wansuia hejianensis]